MQMVKLETFDRTTLAKVFSCLDVKSLLMICETTPQFNEIVKSSKNLMQKIKLTITLLDVGDTFKVNHKQLSDYDQIISRKYQNLKIINLKENLIDNRKSMKKLFGMILDKFSTTVTSLHIKDCYMSRVDVIGVLKKFPNLVDLTLDNVMFSDDLTPSEMAQENAEPLALTFPNLKNLRLITINFFCFLLLNAHTNLEILELSSPIYTRSDVEELENFLLIQRNLKVLKIENFRFNSTYSSNRLHQVPFQLSVLILNDVVWDINDHCCLFIKSQNNLKKFSLQSFQRWITPKEEKFIWFCDVMKHVFNNSQLTSVIFDEYGAFSYLKNDEFLVGDCNRNVKSLQYLHCQTSSSSEFLSISTRLFPNIENLSFATFKDSNIFQTLGLFHHLKSISIKSPTAALKFIPEEIIRNVTRFKFSSTDDMKASNFLLNVLKRNSILEHLFLNIEPLTIEEITELVLSFASTLKTLSIFNLYLNLTEAEMVAKNFPKLKIISSDITPSADVRKLLNDSEISFKSIDPDKIQKITLD